MTRAEVVAEARDWLGVIYRKKGRDRNGIDCLGILVMVGRRFGVPHHDHLDYEDWPDPHHRILHTLDRYLVRVPADALKPAMVGVFAEMRLPGHTGFFSMLHARMHVIHACIAPGAVVEQEYRMTDSGQRLRLVRAYDLPGIED